MSRLGIAIVSYRCPDALDACLTSLAEHGPVDAEPLAVTVVDNASGDDTEALVRSRHPGVELIVNDDNVGFARAANQALRRYSTPWLLSLNPDTIVPPGALDALVAALRDAPEAGIVGPRLERPDGSFDHASRRSFPTLAGALGHLTGVGRLAGAPLALAQYRAPDAEQGGVVDAVCGACLLARREALESAGLFDEGYFMYGEDLDLCRRVAAAGWTVRYEPQVVVTHVKGASSGERRGRRGDVAFHHAMWRFYREWEAPRHSPVTNVAVRVAIAVKLAFSLVRGAASRPRRSL